jgi:hypothetical protein
MSGRKVIAVVGATGARQLNPELLTFDQWLSKNLTTIPVR